MAEGTGSGVSPGADSAAEVYDRVTEAVFAVDEEWRFTHLNDRAETVLECGEQDVLGTVAWQAFPPTVEPTFRQAIEHAMDTQEPATFEEFYAPLETWFEVGAYPSESGVTVSLRDVSDRVRREARLEKRERALRDAYAVIAAPEAPIREKIDDLLGVVRETVGTDYATLSRVEEATGEYVFEAVDAPPDADLQAGDTTDLAATNCERVVDTEEAVVLEDVEADAPELADRAGNAEWGISCYLGAPVVVDDEVYGTFCFYDMEARSEAFTEWEVTFVELLGRWVGSELERERRERDLEASNERLEQFAYAASHDLQEPLRMVSSHLSLLERRYGDELDEDAREFIDFAVDGAERMREMIDGLLQYARVETRGDPFEPVDLDDVLDDVLADLQLQLESSEAEVTTGSLPTVEGDRSQLRQVLQNLLENAIEYSGEGPPQVHVDAERREARRASERSSADRRSADRSSGLRGGGTASNGTASPSRDPREDDIAAETAGEEWVVTVADEGVGIDPEDAEAVFEVFQRLHSRETHEGTGLGLALCERIVERHGGEISVESEPEEGATFSFTLPATDGA